MCVCARGKASERGAAQLLCLFYVVLGWIFLRPGWRGGGRKEPYLVYPVVRWETNFLFPFLLYVIHDLINAIILDLRKWI